MKKINAIILAAVFLSLIGFTGASALTVNLDQGATTPDASGTVNSTTSGVVNTTVPKVPNVQVNPNATGGVNAGGSGTVNVPSIPRVDLNGVVDPNAAGNLKATIPSVNLNSVPDANGNINLVLDSAGNLIGGNGLTQLNLAVPQLGSNGGTSSSSTGSTGNGRSFVVYQTDARAANSNPYATQQFSTAGGNGTIVYYYVVSNPNGVQSDANLQNYTAYTVQNDPNMQKAEVNGSGMDITYDLPANLFGFIPTHVPVDVHIDEDGLATLDYPWYGFLLDTNTDDLQAGIQAKVDSVLNQDLNAGIPGVQVPSVDGSVSGGGNVSGDNNLGTNILNNNAGGATGTVQTNLNEVSPQTKAQIIDGVHSVLKTNAL